MFNGGRFNRTRFNLPEKSAAIYIRENMQETVGAQTDAAQDIHIKVAGAETVAGILAVGCKIATAAEMEAAVEAICAAVANYHTSESLIGTFGVNIFVSLNCHIYGTFTGSMAAKLDIGENIHLEDVLKGAAQFAGSLGVKYTPEAMRAYEIVNCLVSTAVFDTLYVTLDVTIPPKGKLVLDSENFVALLNDQNVIDKHSGSWVELNRSVEQIKVEGGGTSALSVTMLYTERYL